MVNVYDISVINVTTLIHELFRTMLYPLVMEQPLGLVGDGKDPLGTHQAIRLGSSGTMEPWGRQGFNMVSYGFIWFQPSNTKDFWWFLANVVRSSNSNAILASIESRLIHLHSTLPALFQSDWSLIPEQHASGFRLPPKGEEGHGKAQTE